MDHDTGRAIGDAEWMAFLAMVFSLGALAVGVVVLWRVW